jgi:segregation and condensation protein A
MSSAFKTNDIHLQQFEGPLDLLLYLIRKDKIDITDIPIADITRQYLEALREMRRLNLDLAGEYLVMASTLMLIKSRMLLPPDPNPETDEEDPRKELVEKLLAYERYQQAAALLMQRPLLYEDTFHRLNVAVQEDFEDALMVDLGDVSVEDLAEAFRRVIREMETPFVHQVQMEMLTLQDQIHKVMQALQTAPEGVWIREIFSQPVTRLEVVLTLLAVLELVRQRLIHVFQAFPRDEIRLRALPDSGEE